MPKWKIALVLSILGACISTIFCSTWGFTFFDCVDHYLVNYTCLLCGILQCFGACWMYKWGSALERDEFKVHKSMQILAFGYWIPLLVIGFVVNIFMSQYEWALGLSVIVFWVIQLIVWGVSWMVSGLGISDWYKKVFFYGARELAIMLTNGSTDDPDHPPMWRYPFEVWWSFSMKYFFSWAVYWLLIRLLRSDIVLLEGDTTYSGYHVFWQILGSLFPIISILLFLLGLRCTEREKNIDLDLLDIYASRKETNAQSAKSEVVESTKQENPDAVN
jgi:hypothetical protein